MNVPPLPQPHKFIDLMMSQRLSGLVAYHHYEQRACEDRQVEAEAAQDQVQAALLMAQQEQQATHQMVALERTAAALQAAESSQR